MKRTIAWSIDRRSGMETTEWIATVVGVDIVARQLAVNIKGRSGPRRVQVSKQVDMGTAANPKFSDGSVSPPTQVIIKRLDDQYIYVQSL